MPDAEIIVATIKTEGLSLSPGIPITAMLGPRNFVEQPICGEG